MSAQDEILGARVLHVRELKAQIAALKAENSALRAENESLKSHFAIALAAARDLEKLPEGGVLRIYDGWNLVLGADRIANSRQALLEVVRRELAANPEDSAWVVFDGPVGNSFNEERMRVSYTGGEGAQRADRLIADYVRMARLSGIVRKIEVVTFDRKLLKSVSK